MKKIVFITMLFIGIFFLNTPTYSQSDCYDQGVNCGDWVYEGGPVTINIPEYPDCPIWVWYHTRNCNGIIQIWISYLDVELDENDNCHGLRDDLYPLGYGGGIDIGIVANVYESVYASISYKLFSNINDTISENGKESFLCSNDDYLITHTYFKDVCHKFCYYLSPFTNDTRFLRIMEKPCTDQYCCKIEKKYCYNKIWDPGLGKFVYFPTVQETKVADLQVNCNEIIPVSAECPAEPVGYMESECIQSCENPE